LQVGANSK